MANHKLNRRKVTIEGKTFPVLVNEATAYDLVVSWRAESGDPAAVSVDYLRKSIEAGVGIVDTILGKGAVLSIMGDSEVGIVDLYQILTFIFTEMSDSYSAVLGRYLDEAGTAGL
jgi:hypothetical protein